MSNCQSKKCSCEDKGLHSPCPSCESGTIPCPDPNPCPENFSDNCIIHTGDPIVELGIDTGDTLAEILQKIALYLTNPPCYDPTSPCRSPLNVRTLAITSSSVKIGWEITGTPTSFNVRFSPDQGNTWYQNPAVGASATFDTVGYLTADTEYYFKVVANCEGVEDGCSSVTIIVRTLPQTA